MGIDDSLTMEAAGTRTKPSLECRVGQPFAACRHIFYTCTTKWGMRVTSFPDQAGVVASLPGAPGKAR